MPLDRQSGSQRPSELAITLAALPTRFRDSWTDAASVRENLVLLGFPCTTQQVGAWLARMARTECPWVERREGAWSWEYRVTGFGRTDVANRFRGVRPAATESIEHLRAFPMRVPTCPPR